MVNIKYEKNLESDLMYGHDLECENNRVRFSLFKKYYKVKNEDPNWVQI